MRADAFIAVIGMPSLFLRPCDRGDSIQADRKRVKDFLKPNAFLGGEFPLDPDELGDLAEIWVSPKNG